MSKPPRATPSPRRFTGGELSWNKATKEFSSKPGGLAVAALRPGNARRGRPDPGGAVLRRHLRRGWLALVVAGDHPAVVGTAGSDGDAAPSARAGRSTWIVMADRDFFDNDTEDRLTGPDTRTDSRADTRLATSGRRRPRIAPGWIPTRTRSIPRRRVFPTDEDFAEAGYTAPQFDEWVAESRRRRVGTRPAHLVHPRRRGASSWTRPATPPAPCRRGTPHRGVRRGRRRAGRAVRLPRRVRI